MYYAVVVATMLLLPALSVGIDHWLHPDQAVMLSIGRWFVFWGLGVRLFLAGLKQVSQPEFTARDIFQITDPDATKIVSELGYANLSIGLIALASLALPDWTAAAALAGGLFLGLDGIGHVRNSNRNLGESVAMLSDLFVALVCASYLVWHFLR